MAAVSGCTSSIYPSSAARWSGLEYDFERAAEAAQHSPRNPQCGRQSTSLSHPERFDLILSHEVIEHVQDDRAAVREMVRVLKPDGRVVLFCPNRGYPFETHGIYWKGQYYFGNKLFVNYLPRVWRDKLAPHVRVYSRRDLEKLFDGLPVQFVERTIIFGAYDNIIARFGRIGKSTAESFCNSWKEHLCGFWGCRISG